MNVYKAYQFGRACSALAIVAFTLAGFYATATANWDMATACFTGAILNTLGRARS
jgi:hypothetical protein